MQICSAAGGPATGNISFGTSCTRITALKQHTFNILHNRISGSYSTPQAINIDIEEQWIAGYTAWGSKVTASAQHLYG